MTVKTWMTSVGIASLALAGIACAPPAGDEPEEAAPQMSALEATQELAARWDEAEASGDPEQVLALYASDDARTSPPEMPTAVGKDALRAVFSEQLADGGVDVENAAADALESGNIVIGRGDYVLRMTDEAGAPATEEGKWVAAMRRQADGSLLLVHNIWNRDMPPAEAEAPAPIAETGVAPAEDAPCADSPAAIDALFEEYLEKGDVAVTTALHAADGLRMPPGMPAVSGHDGISRYLASRMDPYSERVLDLTSIEQNVEGSLGWTTGQFRFDYTPTGGGEHAMGEGSYMTVATKDDAGCWRYEWVIWNYDAP